MITALFAGVLALFVCACGNSISEQKVSEEIYTIDKETQEDVTLQEEIVETQTEESVDKQEQTQETESIEETDEFSFADLVGQNFMFSSGAGGWATMMNVRADGSFSGQYHDSDMGVTGEEYPYGTVYQCTFSGQFSKPEKINDYTYSMKFQDLKYEKEPGTEEIVDGIYFHYTDPYGLEETRRVYVYLPGAPIAQLSEEFMSWVYYDLYGTDATQLPFYALCNPITQCGFVGYDTVAGIKDTITRTKENSELIKNSIENDPLNQNELNTKSQELFEMWDTTLNMLWDTLENTLDVETMEEVRTEQREWINQKEQTVQEAGAEVEGGSMQPMVMNLRAAALTEERVYELMELLK